jgi:hypothetical protein
MIHLHTPPLASEFASGDHVGCRRALPPHRRRTPMRRGLIHSNSKRLAFPSWIVPLHNKYRPHSRSRCVGPGGSDMQIFAELNTARVSPWTTMITSFHCYRIYKL